MKTNTTTLGTDHADAISIKIGSASVLESNQNKILGAVVDNGGEKRISYLCQNIINKLQALLPVSHLMDQN